MDQRSLKLNQSKDLKCHTVERNDTYEEKMDERLVEESKD